MLPAEPARTISPTDESAKCLDEFFKDNRLFLFDFSSSFGWHPRVKPFFD